MTTRSQGLLLRDDDQIDTIVPAKHPVHPLLVPIPVACFVGALITDIAYWKTANMMWTNFSAWLLLAGLVMGVVAAIAGLIDFLGNRLARTGGPAWPHILGNVAALVLAVFNSFVHTRDGWTSVVPTGLILSALTVMVLVVTTIFGIFLARRAGVRA